MAENSNPALTLAHLMELDLDEPTLEILSAALTVDDCDHVAPAEPLED